jgi:hypothetical protein
VAQAAKVNIAPAIRVLGTLKVVIWIISLMEITLVSRSCAQPKIAREF